MNLKQLIEKELGKMSNKLFSESVKWFERKFKYTPTPDKLDLAHLDYLADFILKAREKGEC
jgi:hypothetical protein